LRINARWCLPAGVFFCTHDRISHRSESFLERCQTALFNGTTRCYKAVMLVNYLAALYGEVITTRESSKGPIGFR